MSKQNKITFELINEYFGKTKETSRLVDPLILRSFKESTGRIVKDDEIIIKLHEAAMQRIGKPKMRSHISMLGYEICNGKNIEWFLPIPVAMDLLEFSYYCSDKIFDTDLKNEFEDVEDKIIISHILTSIIFSLLSDSVDNLKLNNKQISGIMRCIYRFIRNIYEGFYIDNHNKKPSREIYESRVYAYNYWEHILNISAISAEASNENIEALKNFGKYMGMAYMVTNDISDITKNFEDIKNARYTLPNIIFLEKASVTEKKMFKKLFGNKENSTDDFKKIGKAMVDKKIIEECQIYASKLVEKALPHLKIFKDSDSKKMLAISSRAVYKNQWYRSMTELYGYKRNIRPCSLELAGIII